MGEGNMILKFEFTYVWAGRFMKLGARKYTDLIDIYSRWTYPKYLTRTKNLRVCIFFSKKKFFISFTNSFFFELWRENIYVITE